ncbi:hypothetical protein Trydic_g15657 [Trypoxylus dichotomus]
MGKQEKPVTLSSTESEYIALTEAAKEGTHLRNLLSDVLSDTPDVNGGINIFSESQSALKLALNPVFSRSKHIDVRYHFVREAGLNKLIDIKYVPTAETTADILAKGLPKVTHVNFIKNLCVLKIPFSPSCLVTSSIGCSNRK